ncbi:hypothetical protein ACFWXK_30825 [Streptomyces sp. NPDC059070]|uniref:hypothetical protein n=1 Tax=unclassified Streptomyces TaxID=2593676 RepID=UPI0034E2E34F
MSDFPTGSAPARGGDPELARALKRAADEGGRRIVPEPAARVAERGLRRRRRTLAATAACVVCVVAGTGALAALRLQGDSGVSVPANPPSPSGTPTGSPSYGTPSRSPSDPRTPSPGGSGTGSSVPSASVPPPGTRGGSPPASSAAPPPGTSAAPPPGFSAAPPPGGPSTPSGAGHPPRTTTATPSPAR